MAEKKKPRKKKSKVGRPSVMTEEVIQILEESLRRDFTIAEACYAAGISESTYYDYAAVNLEFSEKMLRAKSFIIMQAKHNIASRIMKGFIDDSKWLLERRQRKLYSTRTETELDLPPDATKLIAQLNEGDDFE